MNMSLANWRKSGNGSGNLVPKKVVGINYMSIDNNSNTSFSSDQSNYQFIDDDCADFVKSLQIGYFWSVAEMYDLVDIISQSCAEAGLSSEDGKEIPAVSDRAKGREKKRKKKMMN